MIHIPGQVYLTFKIDGHELGDSANVFGTLSLTESVPAFFPGASFELNDSGGLLSKRLALVDGNSIEITVGRSPDDVRTVTRQYRLLDRNGTAAAPGTASTVYALYDAPKFVIESSTKSYVGTSAEVLAQIAEECKLFWSGPAAVQGRDPRDKQTWANLCSSRAAFVREVADHGYIDEHSAMCCVLTSMGELRYRNLMEIIETPVEKIKVSIGAWAPEAADVGSSTYYRAGQVKERSESGTSNLAFNYGSSRYSTPLSGTVKHESAVDVQTSGSYLPVNDLVASSVTRARREHGYFDCGNTHPEYERALYQNTRLRALFSQRVSVLLESVTELQLLDPVVFRKANERPTDEAALTDVYIVVGKTIHVRSGRRYYERLELVRPTVTEKGSTVLKSATDPGSLLAAAVPPSVVDLTAVGVVKSTLGKAQSLAQMLANAEQFARSAVSAAAAVYSAASNVALVIQRLPTASLTGAVSGLAAAKSALGSYQSACDHFNGVLGQTAAATSEAVAKSLGQPPAIRNLMLTRPGGVSAVTALAASTVSLQNQVASSISAVVANCNSAGTVALDKLGITSKVSEVRSMASGLNAACLQGNSALVSLWNSHVNLLSGKVNQAVSSGSTSLNKVVNNALQPPESYLAKVKSVKDVQGEILSAVQVSSTLGLPAVDLASVKAPAADISKASGLVSTTSKAMSQLDNSGLLA